MEHLLAALDDDIVVGPPFSTKAFPLGDGRAKALGYWSWDDWNTAILSRYDTAVDADSLAAARAFRDLASRFMQAMADRGATTTSQVFDR